MEARTKSTDVKVFAVNLFKSYSDTVYANDYENLHKYYDENAVLIERGKETYFGVNEIVKAIRSYHIGLGSSTTENFNLKVEHTDSIIVISCEYRVQSILKNETIEGEYVQLWKSEIGKLPKILRDEFSIDKRY